MARSRTKTTVRTPSAYRPPDARRFLAGDPETTRAVQRRVRRILWHRAAGLSGTEREELEQEIVVQLWQAASRSGFDLDRDLDGLIDTVAGRRLIDHWRTRREELELPAEPSAGRDGPLDHLLSSERRRLLLEVVSHLGPGCRELIRQVVGEHRTYGELALWTGRKPGTLRVQMHRCVQRARELLGAIESAAEAEEAEG